VDIEKELKVLVEKDVKNPEVFNKILELCYTYLMRRKIVATSDDALDVATIMAEDLYMRVYKGKTHINSWIGYISKSYHSGIRQWRENFSTEIIETNDNYELGNAIMQMCYSMPTSEDYKIIADFSFLEQIPETVDSVMKDSKYYEYTKSYLNTKLTLLISLNKGKFLKYNLDSSESNYARLLFAVVKNKICENIRINNSSDTMGNLSFLQLFALSDNDSLED